MLYINVVFSIHFQIPFKDSNDNDRVFGPIFNDTHFLKPLLHLQQSIENLTTSDGITLKDICLQPLAQSDVCTIQSIWGYFQDSEEKLDEEFISSQGLYNFINRTENYLDHLISCVGYVYVL